MNVNPESPSIVAICTAPGPAGIAVVRLSGTDAYAIADRFCASASLKPSRMEAGRFHFVKLRDPADESPIDEAVVLAYRAPHSYTGEDVVEFQTHGGRVSAARVVQALIACGAQPAGPGEFSKRAFLNGRIDLSMAEAVMDVIGAQSERAGRAAAEQLGGALGRRLNVCYDLLMAVCADVEASLDFADDESTGANGFLGHDQTASTEPSRQRIAPRIGQGVQRVLRIGCIIAAIGVLRGLLADLAKQIAHIRADDLLN